MNDTLSTRLKTRKLYAKGLDYNQIAHILGKNPKAIQGYLYQDGLTNPQTRKKYKQQILQMSRESDYSYEEIAIRLDLDVCLVSHWILSSCPDEQYRIVYDPSGVFSKNAQITLVEFHALIAIGHISNGTIVHTPISGKYYKAKVVTEIMEIQYNES